VGVKRLLSALTYLFYIQKFGRFETVEPVSVTWRSVV